MLSLASGLFISFMGFEEVKSAVAQMSLESQSRLDNLIELDKKFNVAHETWKYDEAELQNELDRTTQLLKREKEDLLALEKFLLLLERSWRYFKMKIAIF